MVDFILGEDSDKQPLHQAASHTYQACAVYTHYTAVPISKFRETHKR